MFVWDAFHGQSFFIFLVVLFVLFLVKNYSTLKIVFFYPMALLRMLFCCLKSMFEHGFAKPEVASVFGTKCMQDSVSMQLVS